MYNIYLWLNLPQKLSQPVAFQRFFLFRSPFWTSTNSLTPFKFLSSFTPHCISLGDDYDEERDERRCIPQSPVLKQLGRTTETLATLCVYFWHLVNGFEVSKFPALIVSPAATEPPCQKPSWAALHDLNKNWAKPAKCGDFLLTSQLIPAPLGGSWLRRWSVLWNIVNATTQLNKNELVFHQLPERPNVSFILKSLYTLPLESPKSALGIIGPSSWVLKSHRLHYRRAGIHKNITQLSKGAL